MPLYQSLDPDLSLVFPITYLTLALVTFLGVSLRTSWRLSELGAGAVAFLAVGGAAWQLGTHLLVEVDLLGWCMTILISLLGLVVIRYSRRYLDGERGQRRYLCSLLLTLAAVATLVMSQHIGLIVVCWFAVSIGLHQLLTFYRDRRPARIAAHKKFILSRIADAMLVAFLALVYLEVGSLQIDALEAALREEVTFGLHLAAFLLAAAVLLRTAQIPLHGWLIQVMEAPTPVSALLHAGVINLGGFVLLRLHTLISLSSIAQVVLVVSGLATVLVASLVMTTRISIKVRLAWSTCAQMGMMLVECGLGLYELALLHIIAHSAYKSYSFLNAGNQVAHQRFRTAIPLVQVRGNIVDFTSRIVTLPISVGIVAVSLLPALLLLQKPQPPVFVLMLISVGVAPFFWRAATTSVATLSRAALNVFLLVQLYVIWHALFGIASPALYSESETLWLLATIALVGLFLMQTWLSVYSQSSLARRLHYYAYGGLYLDEYYTALALKLWPLERHDKQPQHEITGINTKVEGRVWG